MSLEEQLRHDEVISVHRKQINNLLLKSIIHFMKSM